MGSWAGSRGGLGAEGEAGLADEAVEGTTGAVEPPHKLQSRLPAMRREMDLLLVLPLTPFPLWEAQEPHTAACAKV